jgi:uncharacterized protein YdbL (DUF1318 family)
MANAGGPPLDEVARTMTDAVSSYVQGELGATSADFDLLEQMNQSSAAEYRDLTEHARLAAEEMDALQEKCACCLFVLGL